MEDLGMLDASALSCRSKDTDGIAEAAVKSPVPQWLTPHAEVSLW
jgi:hypothetical protein